MLDSDGITTYNPVVARFVSADTYYGQSSDPLSLNLYTYCHNEPLMYSDPTGHSWISNAVKAVGKAVSNTAKAAVTVVSNTAKAVVTTTTNAVRTVATTVKKSTNAVIAKASTIASNVASYVSNTASAVGQFVVDNKEAIIIGAVAVASVALGVVTLGASLAIESAILGSALIGGGIALGITEAKDLSDNGKIDMSAKQYLGAYAGGAVTGALVPFAAGAGSVASTLALYGAGTAAGDVTQQYITTGKVDAGEAATAGTIGAVTGGLIDYGIPALASGLKSLAGTAKNAATNAFENIASGTKALAADNSGFANPGAFGARGAGSATEGAGNATNSIERITGSIAQDKPVIVIGETMGRVNPVADDLTQGGFNVKTYNPQNFRSSPGNLNSLDVEANRSWIRYWTQEKGATVVDIGIDPSRITRSPFYGVENRSVYQNWNYPNVINYNPGK